MPPVAMQTAEDLFRFREPGKTAELVRGVLIVREPPGTGHGVRSAQLLYRVADFVVRHDLGEVIAQDTGFKIEHDPDTVRAPDAAFVARDRLGRISDEGYAELAPDWVAEILSPSDRPGEVLEKVGQWLNAGVRLVWVLDPRPSPRADLPCGRDHVDPGTGRGAGRRGCHPRLSLSAA